MSMNLGGKPRGRGRVGALGYFKACWQPWRACWWSQQDSPTGVEDREYHHVRPRHQPASSGHLHQAPRPTSRIWWVQGGQQTPEVTVPRRRGGAARRTSSARTRRFSHVDTLKYEEGYDLVGEKLDTYNSTARGGHAHVLCVQMVH